MASVKKFAAVITASPALGSIIAMMLDNEEQLGVQQFNDADALAAHMRIVPVDLIVMDYHLEGTSAAQLVLNMRRELPHRQFETLVLTDRVTPQVKLACKFASIDEVIIKPMSPVFLKERVLSRLRARNLAHEELGAPGKIDDRCATLKPEIEATRQANWPGNVVPLFGTGENPARPRPPNQPHPS